MASRRRLMALLAFALVALLPLVAGHALAADPPVYAPVGPGDVYLALGDSLATGYEVVDDGKPGYPAYLLDYLRQVQPAITLTNLGNSSVTFNGVTSGETSSTFLQPGGQLEAATAFIASERAAGRRVSPVTLSIGGNDAVAVILPGSTATVTASLTLYRTNLERILDTLVASLAVGGQRTGDLVLMSYYNPYPGLKAASPVPLNANPDLDVPRFNQIIVEEAAERGIPIVNAYSAFLGREPQLTNVRFPYNFIGQLDVNFDFHPREAGHRVLARGFAEATGYTLKLPRLYLPLARQ